MPKLNKRDTKISSGKHKVSKVMKQLRRLKMKANRWNRYREEIKAGNRKGKASRWDTSGLEKHMALLESMI
jgi:hypothetical protein